ncbi:MAG TPA: hypothetical protein VEU76_06555, partial [Candidatus Udaeobacter sp.]|nr:hypothetical protein [Candidatus Udaeobacter sp.]
VELRERAGENRQSILRDTALTAEVPFRPDASYVFGVAARVPLDVDLEDKLLYGLTPMRLGYLIVGLLAAFSIWSAHWGPGVLRGAIATILGAVGVVAAWGRWRGRALDGWAVDLVTFVLANFRVSRH